MFIYFMTAPARFALPLAAVFLLGHCAATPDDDAPLGEPKLDKLEHAKLDPGPEDEAGQPRTKPQADAGVPATGLVPVSGKDGRFVIRDAKGAMRVDGVLREGRMDGPWKYFDPTGRRLAGLSYRGDQRHGPITLFYVTADGKAAGKKRMAGAYDNGSLNGMAISWYPTGGKQLEREFDSGILQGSRGWQENGQEMTDGAAQSAALDTSRAEDALLEELEAFVQLKIRQNANTKP